MWLALPERWVALRAGLLAVIVVAGWGGWQVWRAESGSHAPPPALPARMIGSTAAPVPTDGPGDAGLGRSAPVKIVIQSIRLLASVDQVGLTSDGRLEEPSFSRANRAAWYRLGPAPGQVGPAVIEGHVDTKTSVAVFFYLSRLRPGDRVVITRADRHTVTFSVDGLALFPKSDFPSQLVYGATNYPALRLITCGGTFDRAAGSYQDNLVVFAHLATYT